MATMRPVHAMLKMSCRRINSGSPPPLLDDGFGWGASGGGVGRAVGASPAPKLLGRSLLKKMRCRVVLTVVKDRLRVVLSGPESAPGNNDDTSSNDGKFFHTPSLVGSSELSFRGNEAADAIAGPLPAVIWLAENTARRRPPSRRHDDTADDDERREKILLAARGLGDLKTSFFEADAKKAGFESNLITHQGHIHMAFC